MVGAYTNRNKADKVNGTANVTNTSTFYNRKNFIACRMSVKYYVAEIIDKGLDSKGIKIFISRHKALKSACMVAVEV